MKLRHNVRVVLPAVALAFLVMSSPLAQQPEATPSGQQKSVKQKNLKADGLNQKRVNQKSVKQKGDARKPASQADVNQAMGETARQPPRNEVAQSMVGKGPGTRAARPDEPMARLVKVDGDVLVSTESGLVAGEQGGALQEGTRVITMANGSVLLAYRDGCNVSMSPNERIEISEELPCDERPNQVRLAVLDPSLELLLEGQTASIPALALTGLLQGGVATSTGLVGLAAVVGGREDTAVSPN